MYRRLLVIAALGAAFVSSSSAVYSQFGGVQVQVGGNGTGVRVGNMVYGNGYYRGYGNGFGNQYNGNYGNYGYGSRFGNYSNSYYNQGIGYNNFPNYSYRYVAPRAYTVPLRNYPLRRYRYR